jgi:CHAT domain-containing protein
VGLAFVAGNPEPLGLGLDQLKGATGEAEEVAELLNVEAIVGGRVTKEAVIKDLSSACLVVLGTHGVVDVAHPHGALVLQGCKPLLSVSQKTASELNGDDSSSLRSARQRLFSRGSLEKAFATASETLTPEEITALPGGVQTGLVVLSACQTGKGEVTSEGVFNLWCALLQAGAPAIIVSLWKVDDGSTKALIKGMRTPWSWIEVLLLLVCLFIFSVNLALLQIVKEAVGLEAVDIICT